MPRTMLYAFLAISLLFVTAGIGMVATGAEGGWPGLLFFGLCAVTFVGQLWPDILGRPARSTSDLLAGFPGPVELRVGGAKIVALIVGSGVFGGVILWMLLNESVAGWRTWLLWPAVVMIGLAFPVFLVLLIRGGALRLTAEGFEMRHGWTRRTTSWRDAGPFEVAKIPPTSTQLVVYDEAGASTGRLAGANVAITGHTSALPDGYGFAHEDLAALLNAWRERALGGR